MAQESSEECGLATQDLATLNPAALNPLSPEVISRQATINIGPRCTACP
jgi:hypothetical protein